MSEVLTVASFGQLAAGLVQTPKSLASFAAPMDALREQLEASTYPNIAKLIPKLKQTAITTILTMLMATAVIPELELFRLAKRARFRLTGPPEAGGSKGADLQVVLPPSELLSARMKVVPDLLFKR